MPKELTDAHKEALANGRARRADKRRQEAITRVKQFRKWNRDDAENGRPGKRKPMPQVPSDADYDLARKSGAIT